MTKPFPHSSISLVLLAFALSTPTQAQDATLFNGKNIEGWSVHLDKDQTEIKEYKPWTVHQGLLVCTGSTSGYLLHAGEYENYVLSLDWRWMRLNGNGVAISGSGSVYIHATDEIGRFNAPKSVEVSLDDVGAVYFRDVEPRVDSKLWAFHAPDFADDVEKEMGEWNHLQLISRDRRLTVIVNGVAVNQIEGLNRNKGAIALKSQRGFAIAPTFYRNIRIQPITASDLQAEKNATQQLGKFKAVQAKKEATEKAKRAEMRRVEQAKQDKFASEWANLKVTQEIEFKPDSRYLPFPANAREMEFSAPFGDIDFSSPSSLEKMSDFYRTELSKRGWRVTETEVDDDSVEVTFQNENAKLELSLDQESDGTDVSMGTEGLSFEGTNDPKALVALRVPQPKAYLFLQQEIQLPENIQKLGYDNGDRCMFKSTLKLQQAFDFFGQQLRKKGYRESRRPIVTDDRRYTEFTKGNTEISVNIFKDAVGSRCIIEYEPLR